MKTKSAKPYNKQFVAKILQGDVDLKNEKGTKISLKQLQKIIYEKSAPVSSC